MHRTNLRCQTDLRQELYQEHMCQMLLLIHARKYVYRHPLLDRTNFVEFAID